jgi:hypothetical protein
MDTKRFNWILIVGAVVLIAITPLFAKLVPNQILIMCLFFVWVLVGMFGALNFTRWPMWVKGLVTVLITPLVVFVLSFLFWAFTGFRV